MDILNLYFHTYFIKRRKNWTRGSERLSRPLQDIQWCGWATCFFPAVTTLSTGRKVPFGIINAIFERRHILYLYYSLHILYPLSTSKSKYSVPSEGCLDRDSLHENSRTWFLNPILCSVIFVCHHGLYINKLLCDHSGKDNSIAMMMTIVTRTLGHHWLWTQCNSRHTHLRLTQKSYKVYIIIPILLIKELRHREVK